MQPRSPVPFATPPRDHSRLRWVPVLYASAMFLTSCGTVSTDPPAPAPVEEPVVVPRPEPTPQTFSLRGDVTFSIDGLSDEQRRWFERSWSAIDASLPKLVSQAGRDDVYIHGRELFQFSSALLLGLRSTGDLHFLDALDEVMQAIRDELYDGWCGGVESTVFVNSTYGTVVARDGYRNLRLRYDEGKHHCRDTGDLNETLAHGHLAMVMYAYHMNRDQVSPGGVDYAERADFWFEYLRDDFEAKWRERSHVSWPAMDFIDLKFSHTYTVFTLYYYFMGQKLASEGDPDATPYLDMAARLTDAMFEQPYEQNHRGGGFVPVEGPNGDAVVYSFGAPGRGPTEGPSLQASPMTYSRYVMSAVLALRLEQVPRWDDAIMARLANGLTGFVIDIAAVESPKDTIAAGVTGTEERAGMPATTYRSRLTMAKFAVTTMPAYAVWDATGEIETVSMQTFDVMEPSWDRPANVYIPLSQLFVETARAGGLVASALR